MNEYLGQRYMKDGPNPESYNSVADLFTMDPQEEYREIKVTSAHRESPSGYMGNFKPSATTPGKEEMLSEITTSSATRQKQNWIFSQGYGEKVMADAGLMIRCAVPDCDRLYRSVNGSTSSIRNHLKRKHGIEGPLEGNKPSASPLISVVSTPQPKKLNTKPTVEPSTSQPPPRKPVAPLKPKYVPLEDLEENLIPLEILQDPRLLRFIGTSLPVNSHINVSVSPDDAASLQVQIYKSKVRDTLRRQIGVSLTLGRWNNGKGLKQIVVTAHFVDNDWKPKELLLGIFNPSAQTNLEHARQLLHFIEEYEFGNVLHTITTDYGPDMCIIIQELSKMCAAKNIRFVPTDQHVPCLGFIINNTVNNVLKFGISSNKTDLTNPHFSNQVSINERLEKFRGGISNILGSIERLMHFQTFFLKNHTQYKELILDVPNEWDTTYQMVETLLEVKQAYNDTCYCSDLNKLAITAEDAELLEEMKNFLGPFHAFSIRVSGTRYPTINRAVVMYDKILSYLASFGPHKQPFIQHAYLIAHQGLKNYFAKNPNAVSCPTAIYPIASVMDPRLKYNFWKPPSYLPEDRERFIAIVSNYWEKNCRVADESTVKPHYPSSSFDNIFEMEPIQSSDDLGRYVQEPTSPSSFTSEAPVWDYWRQTAHSYPQLSKMARKFLCIPATSLPCENQLVHSGKFSKDSSSPVSQDMCLLLSWKSTLG